MISIHAPAKGATLDLFCVLTQFVISIHAPAKGATALTLILQPSFNLFQSTLPRRERLYTSNQSYDCAHISIHAPAKGATRTRDGHRNAWRFQSTLPRRERRHLLHHLPIMSGISIHAPAKGATAKQVADLNGSLISIHAPAKGATDKHEHKIHKI